MPFIIPFIPAIAAAGAAAVAAATVALTIVEMAALYFLSKLLAPSPPGSQLSNGATEEYNGTVSPRRIVYGTNLISGLNVIPPWCHGQNNQMLDQVLLLAGHEVAAVLDCYANQEFIPSASITNYSQTLSDGLVTTGTFANKLWIRRHTGSPADNQVDTILTAAWPGSWDTTHLGLGLAKLYVQYQFDATVYSGGKAEIRAIVKGKKVYDPRLDTTPGANPTNSAYIAYSPNPALCICDYILDPVLGIGETAARIDWPSVVAAANLCDEFVSVPLRITTVPVYDAAHQYSVGDSCKLGSVVYACTVATVGHTPPNAVYWTPQAAGAAIQRRYSCDTVLDCTNPYENNLKIMAASFQGSVLYSAGKWILLPGHYMTPTFTIGDDDIAGAFDFQTAIPFASRYNAVRGQFYDPTNLYQPTEYPPIRVAADELADGEGPVWRELQQPTCTDMFEAQRNAMIEQRKSRRKKSWSFPATYRMYSIRPGDFGQLSITELGIVNQYVRCTGWKLDGKAMTMVLHLEEVDVADWNDPAVAFYQTLTALATPAPANFISDPVTAFSAVGGNGGITFKWTIPAIWHSNLSVELWESLTNNFAFATLAWSGANTGAFLQKGDTIVRYYWVLVRNFAGSTVSVLNPNSIIAGLPANSLTSGGGPAGPPGPAGSGGLTGSLTLQDMVFPATAAGHVTSYANGSGQFQVYVGTNNVTSLCTFSVAPAGNLSGLTYTLIGEIFTSDSVTAQSETLDATGSVIASGTGVVVTGQGESATATGNAGSNTANTGEAQTVVAAGKSGSAVRFDATNLRFDSTAKRWDAAAVAGSGGGPPPPVSGTGATSE